MESKVKFVCVQTKGLGVHTGVEVQLRKILTSALGWKSLVQHGTGILYSNYID